MLLNKTVKYKAVLKAFIEIVHESNHKANNSQFDQEREFHNKLMQEWLDNNNILMYLTHNEGKSLIAERLKST